jgi:hypothetical protein
MIQFIVPALLLALDVQSSPQEFAKRYRARQQSIQTATVRSTWEDFKDGKPTRRDRQTIYIDMLGRRRLQMQSEQRQEDGTWVPHEQVPYEWDRLFDGSLTASMTFDPRKDRVGNTPKEGSKSKGYRTAQIFDGRKDVDDARTALTFADGIITILESTIKNKIPVDVKDETESQVTFHFADDKDGEFWICEADKTRDWEPVVIARVDQSGKAIMRTDFEYATTSFGLLYPQKGIHRYYGDRSEQDTPLWETRFEVTECKINEPDFDEDIFKIALYPDTAVFDSRYDVNYRVGTENTYTSQLAALAQSALEAQKENPEGPPPEKRAFPIVGWVNLVVGAVVIAVIIGRRWLAKA